MLDRLYSYVENIKNGKILACNEIKLAVNRFESDLLRKDLEFRITEVKKVVKFIESLKHEKDNFVGKNFILSPWQVFIISNVFGFYYSGTNRRKYTDVYIEVSRKNGKTHFIAAILLYILSVLNDSPEIILAANSRKQAIDVDLAAVKSLIDSIDKEKKYYRYNRNQVYTLFKKGLLTVVSNETKSLDGYNLSAFVIDEFHEATNFKMLNVLKSSQGNRSKPIRFIITTAGFSKKSPCYSLRKTAKDVLEGIKNEDSLFSMIFTLDQDDDWKDKNNWIKSNPNLGITVSEDYLSSEIQAAINNIDLETGVKTKNLNIWCDTITTWISDNYVLGSLKSLDFKDIPYNVELYCAVDLSSVSDITSVSYMYNIDNEFYFINNYYLPEDSLNSNDDKEYYKNQYFKGNIKLIPGKVVDYDYIIEDILSVNKIHYIDKIAYDRWNAEQFYNNCNSEGLNMYEYPQTLGNFNKPTKEFERLLLKERIVIDNNDITRWMISNVSLRKDGNGNVKPDKERSSSKIDGVISMLMCLGIYLSDPYQPIDITKII